MRLISLPIPGHASHSAAPEHPTSPAAAKQRVATISLAAAAGLLTFKLLVGLHAHSLGVLADAAHSGLDLIATLLTWASIRVAARPADANHPFGHGKFENFSAFLETTLLVFTAVIVMAMAIRQWLGQAEPIRLDAWPFAVMLVSIAVDWSRVRILRRAAAQFHSDALEADALNFASDLWTSLAVLLGLAAAGVGQLRHIDWLLHADSVAAIFVGLAMLALAYRLGRRAAGVLLDEAPPRLLQQLRAAIQDVDGVLGLQRLRLRRVGATYFVDLQLTLDQSASLENARLVREAVTGRIQRQLPEADVVVETRPRGLAGINLLEQVKAVALRHNLALHNLSIFDVGSGMDVEFHLELPEHLPLARAHELVSGLESEIRVEIPVIRQILTHIEPATAKVAAANVMDPGRITRRVQQIAANIPALLDCHDIQVRQVNGHLALSCHCSFADDLPISAVHERITGLEGQIRRALPELFRITIHPEPGSDNRR